MCNTKMDLALLATQHPDKFKVKINFPPPRALNFCTHYRYFETSPFQSALFGDELKNNLYKKDREFHIYFSSSSMQPPFRPMFNIFGRTLTIYGRNNHAYCTNAMYNA